jgi:hypothetical protein
MTRSENKNRSKLSLESFERTNCKMSEYIILINGLHTRTHGFRRTCFFFFTHHLSVEQTFSRCPKQAPEVRSREGVL